MAIERCKAATDDPDGQPLAHRTSLAKNPSAVPRSGWTPAYDPGDGQADELSAPGAGTIRLQAGDDGSPDLRLWLRLIVGIAAFQTVVHLVNASLLDRGYWHLNADEEGNGFTWAASLSLLLAAVAALGTAVFQRRERGTNYARVAILAFFAIDEVAKIHERLGVAAGERLLPDPSSTSRYGSGW